MAYGFNTNKTKVDVKTKEQTSGFISVSSVTNSNYSSLIYNGTDRTKITLNSSHMSHTYTVKDDCYLTAEVQGGANVSFGAPNVMIKVSDGSFQYLTKMMDCQQGLIKHSFLPLIPVKKNQQLQFVLRDNSVSLELMIAEWPMT